MGRRWLREGAGKQAAMSWSAARGEDIRSREEQHRSLPAIGARGWDAVRRGVKELLGEGGPARDPGGGQRRFCQGGCALRCS